MTTFASVDLEWVMKKTDLQMEEKKHHRTLALPVIHHKLLREELKQQLINIKRNVYLLKGKRFYNSSGYGLLSNYIFISQFPK